MKCDSGYLLKSDDECAETTMLDNCVYMSEKECSLCDRGYVVISGKCKVIEASNCKTYESEK